MPARRTPEGPGRPRKIVDEYDRLANGFDAPTYKTGTLRDLRGAWSRYLAGQGVDSEDVDVKTFHGFLDSLREKGFTHHRMNVFVQVRAAHVLVWNSAEYAGTKWPRIAAEVEKIQVPKAIDDKEPHQPFALTMGPKILDASRFMKQRAWGSHEEIYNEAPAVVGTLLYSAGRAQFYGLRTRQVQVALGVVEQKDCKHCTRGVLETYVKGGHLVHIPIPDQLLRIWEAHLEERDYKGSEFLFRRGHDPYVYKDPEASKRLAAKGIDPANLSASNASANHTAIQTILTWQSPAERKANKDCVRRRLLEIYGIDEELTAHRFRTHVSTYYDSYGLKENGPENRLVLSHGAQSINAHYNRKNILEVQAKISQIDLGSAEWIAAHDPPSNLFDENARRVERLESQLQEQRERNDRLEKKLDAILARSEPRVIA